MSGLLSNLRKEDGVSLIELVIYSAILFVIIGGAYTIYEGSEAIYSSASSQTDAQRSGRIAMMLMTKDLRMTESFVQADDYAVDIRADLNDDNVWEDVSYYVDKDSNGNYCLYTKQGGGQAKQVAYGVKNIDLNQPLFTYYDSSDTAITTDTASRKTKTWKIDINLVIDTTPNRPPGAYTLSSKVTLRNGP